MAELTGQSRSLLLILLAGLACAAEPAPRVAGKLRLVCDSPWHKLDLTLTPGPLVLDKEAWEIFNLPVGVRPEQVWKVEAKALQPLIQGLHGVAWRCEAKDQAAYKTWLGRGTALQTLGMQGGTLDITYRKDADGPRLEFQGAIKAFDAGRYTARQGPTGFKEDWNHQLAGKLWLDESGVPTTLELTDTFATSGLFFNQQNKKKESESFTRTGQWRGTVTMPRAVTPAEQKKVQQLIAQLGAENFAEREAASRQLAALGPKIAPLLRGLGLASPDPEIVRRSKAILAEFDKQP